MQLLCIPESFSPSLSANRIKAMIQAASKVFGGSVSIRTLHSELSGMELLELYRASKGGQFVVMPVMGPCGVPVTARYLSAGDTAVIAASEAAGMHLRQPGFSALNTTSYGVGELLAHALSAGHRNVIVSLAGICCADAGCGLAAALGVRFFNRQGKPFLPMGASLTAIDKIQPNRFFLSPNAHKITVLAEGSDTLNAPQALLAKVGAEDGVTQEHVALLEAGLRHVAATIQRQGGEKLLGLAGGLTGGGALAGMRGMLYAQVENDPSAVFATEGEKTPQCSADLIVAALPEVTLQSLESGLIAGVLREKGRAPFVLLTRFMPENADDFYAAGVSAIFPVAPVSSSDTPLGQDAYREDLMLKAALENIFRLLSTFGGESAAPCEP